MRADRADLLELTPEALLALANAGFVKRAQKEMAEGKAPELAQEADGTLHAAYADGTRTSLAAGRSLRDAVCSCIASGLCRHRILLVLAYQQACRNAASAAQPAGEGMQASVEEGGGGTPVTTPAGLAGGPWSPADFDDAALQAALRPATLRQAAELARARPVARLAGWRVAAPVPTAHLPMCTVRFFRCGFSRATALATRVAIATRAAVAPTWRWRSGPFALRPVAIVARSMPPWRSRRQSRMTPLRMHARPMPKRCAPLPPRPMRWRGNCGPKARPRPHWRWPRAWA
ncbi:hypothetical protein OR16_14159 [Cupriavidus basilensis OR16]|uniref:SWIM-type domain-containing protein n=1 Tax=Cupriavidus basilensis OR16 TaxID=1127483 RepID=H1S4U2_9BURK|nr:hypothetical protein OR16_14159 [Cupriavidus basilensis OR16]